MSEKGRGMSTTRQADTEAQHSAGWRCAAVSNPEDCGWPFCGCDPSADRVIAAIQEHHMAIVPIIPTQAMLRAGVGVVGWRPIESAPRDGTHVDIWAAGRRWPNMRWDDAGWAKDGSRMVRQRGREPFAIKASTIMPDLRPSHWMPLPEPPESGT